jgi:hypothetical protein
MLLATDIPTEDERKAAHAVVPWSDRAFWLAGTLRGALDHGAVEFIDAALGPPHARAVIVALYEGADVLLQAAIDLADAITARSVLSRIDPHDPLGADDSRLNGPGKQRLPLRTSRFRVEDAAVKVASAGDHLANVHLRIAWETNAASADELIMCGFDPSEETPRYWASCEGMRLGLRRARKSQLGIFRSFVLNGDFRSFYANQAVRSARRYRDEIVHRERPSYAEVPSFGRATRWSAGSFKLTFPAPPSSAAPSIEDRTETVSAAGEATLLYANAIWDVVLRWLRTANVWITRDSDDVKVQAMLPSAAPRELRDPGPFLVK